MKRIKKRGYKEIMLLGQNVNSYCDSHHVPTMSYQITSGFTSSTNNKQKGILFPELLDIIATEVPEIRLRFMSPHPKVRVLPCNLIYRIFLCKHFKLLKIIPIFVILFIVHYNQEVILVLTV